MTPTINDTPAVDGPPPPYSETDIYSTNGRSPILGQSQTLPIRPRAASHNSAAHSPPVVDDASSTTSNSEVIYTPPLTPRSSASPSQQQSPVQSQNADPNNSGLLSPYYPGQQNTVSVASEEGHLSTSSAQAYFESRPSLRANGDPRYPDTINLLTGPHSSPDDFQYQQDYGHWDILEQDWQTFVNHLFPNHAAECNEHVIDRKLRAEGIENTTIDKEARNEKSDNDANARSPVEVQLDQIRSPGPQYGPHTIEDTIHEWNDGFFGPRGVTVLVRRRSSGEDELRRMPVAWDDNGSNSPSQTNNGISDPNQPPSSRWWRFNPLNRPDTRGLRFGGLHIDNDRVAIGSSFVADSNGLRIGSLTADDNGVRIHGRDLFGGAGRSPRARGQPPTPPGPHSAPPMPPMPPMPSMPAMPAMPPMPSGFSHEPTAAYFAQMPPAPPGIPHPAPPPDFVPSRAEDHDEKVREHGHHHHHHGHHDEPGGRGRGRYRQGMPQRRRSSSSYSSSSSSSSSSSDSADSDMSVGSLPDYDDLKDSQLPVARSYLEDWLSHPDQLVTREKVKEVKESLKAAKRTKATGPTPVAVPTSNNDNRNIAPYPVDNQEHAAMRAQVRALLVQWSQLKRQQKQTRRQVRRERKTKRRAEKREKRQTKREVRRAKKELRREAKREGRRGGSRHRGGGEHHGGGPHAHPRPTGRGPFGHAHGHAAFGGHPAGFPFRAGGGGGGCGANFPGAGFGPGARERGGGLWGGRRGGGGFGPGPDFHRDLNDWTRRMSEWGQRMGGMGHVPAPAPGHDQRPPGAWPSDDNLHTRDVKVDVAGDGQEVGVQGLGEKEPGGAHAGSAVLYRQLEAKRADLRGKKEALAEFERTTAAEGDLDSSGGEPEASTLLGMLTEMEEVERAVESLSIEADEQYAKELVDLEH